MRVVEDVGPEQEARPRAPALRRPGRGGRARHPRELLEDGDPGQDRPPLHQLVLRLGLVVADGGIVVVHVVVAEHQHDLLDGPSVAPALEGEEGLVRAVAPVGAIEDGAVGQACPHEVDEHLLELDLEPPREGVSQEDDGGPARVGAAVLDVPEPLAVVDQQHPPVLRDQLLLPARHALPPEHGIVLGQVAVLRDVRLPGIDERVRIQDPVGGLDEGPRHEERPEKKAQPGEEGAGEAPSPGWIRERGPCRPHLRPREGGGSYHPSAAGLRAPAGSAGCDRGSRLSGAGRRGAVGRRASRPRPGSRGRGARRRRPCRGPGSASRNAPIPPRDA